MNDFALARSWLFIPGDNPKKLAKAANSNADVVIFDLEDAVAPSRKENAREQVVNAVTELPRSAPLTCVRVNPFDSGLAEADIRAVMPAKPKAIMLPKLFSADELHRVDMLLNEIEHDQGIAMHSTAVVALVSETAQMLLALPELADLPSRVVALSWGAEDLAAALGASRNTTKDGGWRFTYQLARSLCQLTARRNDVSPVDTVYTDFGNDRGLAEYAQRAREDGFDGMLAIHPRQVDIINQCFAPSPEDVRRAESVLEAFARDPSAGVVRLDNEMLDEPHRVQARKTLDRVVRRQH